MKFKSHQYLIIPRNVLGYTFIYRMFTSIHYRPFSQLLCNHAWNRSINVVPRALEYAVYSMYNKQECSWLFWKVFQSTMNLWPFLEVFLKADFHKSHINLISHIFIHIDIIYGYDRKYFHDWKVILINWMVIFI